MAWLVRREYTRAELGRRLLQRLREAHRKAAARIAAAGETSAGGGAADSRRRARWQADAAEALADAFAPPPPAPPLATTPGARAATDDAEAVARFDAPVAQAAIGRLLDRFEQQGLLSDARAAAAIVDARKGRRGLLRLQQELAQKGVAADAAADALADVRLQQVPLARSVWARKFGRLPEDAAARQKQTRFLAARGFSFDVIRQVLGGSDDDHDPSAGGGWPD